MTDPVFGKKEAALNYKERDGVYAIVPDASGKRIMTLAAPNGAVFLPGGGVEAGETDAETLNRELLEEFGVAVKIDGKLGRAAEYFYSHHRQTAYYHPATFYATSELKVAADPLEDFNVLMMMPISIALAQLKRPTHRYALSEWIKYHNGQRELD
ncbi:NUDIX domain-containing protein [Lacticaseibacillus pabuli]|uniref:NUDIX domain-containing protein n=1 Tax=Lacticaseibacillus pabuli TaxID=3025672 RepID=A0ABY7WSF0_9LACO|nr:NUDIX domain-containing protein [Lacticaseibacillus sp. KACC 23028]WDF83097.1 NUDIX domain-containing protein [Lacticaseibacillus sp. KACC 23028]